MGKKMTTVSCREIKYSIKRYLMNEMELEEAENFVRHIRSCKECREELEEYYAFSAALMQIESLDETEKGNFVLNVERRLERTEKNAAKVKSDHIKRRLIFGFIAIALAAAMGVSIGG